MKQFIQLFYKINGAVLLKQYLKAHVLFFSILQIINQGFTKTSLEIVRLSVNNKILKKLRKKYKKDVQRFVRNYTITYQEKCNKVWICWLQGIENAPEIVKICYKSMQSNLTNMNNGASDREIILLTKDNYREYICFPQHIQNKIDNGIITKTHISDLLRLELLSRYGGTWIDATVYCSGKSIPSYMFDANLFFYQTLKPGKDGHATVLSSWFITACSNHPVILLTKELLYKYWEDNNSLIDYFLIHDFFQIALEAFPDEWDKVIPRDNAAPHILLLRIFDRYDLAVWESITEQTCFHKLSYKFTNRQTELEGTYYKKLLQKGTL